MDFKNCRLLRHSPASDTSSTLEEELKRLETPIKIGKPILWSDVLTKDKVLPREAHPRQMNFRKKDKRRNFRKKTETFSRSKSANASVLGNLFD